MPHKTIGGIDVSRETYADLETFAALVVKWTQKINLIAPKTSGQIWERHVADSAQLLKFAPQHFTHWVDLGSGGGFPGMVVAIMSQSTNPAAKLTLIESDLRKATFLRVAAQELSLPVTVVAQRIGDAAPQEADVVSARALSPLPQLLGETRRHMAGAGRAILPKGKTAKQEIAEAYERWQFDLEDHPSITDPAARVLVIQRITPRVA